MLPRPIFFDNGDDVRLGDEVFEELVPVQWEGPASRSMSRSLGRITVQIIIFAINNLAWRRLSFKPIPSATCTSQTRDEVPDGAFFLFVSKWFSEAIRLSETGVSAEIGLAEHRKCARSWRRVPDVGSDPAYPDLSARDADAVRDWDKARG